MTRWKSFFDFLDDNGMELMDSLYVQSLQELHAYAPNVVDTLTRFGATQERAPDGKNTRINGQQSQLWRGRYFTCCCLLGYTLANSTVSRPRESGVNPELARSGQESTARR